MEKNNDTKQRVLESAMELFASKGYAETSLKDISGRAGANKAAINYHFRSKENLYVEAWRLAFERSLAAHPLDGVADSASAEDRLRGHVLAMARRITDPETREFDMIEKERANPTGLLAEIMRKSIEPVQKRLEGILQELLGDQAQPSHVLLCMVSTMSQCIHIFLQERPGSRIAPRPPLGLDIESIADHIATFSLAGIRDMRRRIEEGEA